jgi:hypothetical protein
MSSAEGQEVLRLFLECGANPNGIDGSLGAPPFHAAVRAFPENIDLMRAFLEHKGDPNAFYQGQTVFQALIASQAERKSTKPDYKEIIDGVKHATQALLSSFSGDHDHADHADDKRETVPQQVVTQQAVSDGKQDKEPEASKASEASESSETSESSESEDVLPLLARVVSFFDKNAKGQGTDQSLRNIIDLTVNTLQSIAKPAE